MAETRPVDPIDPAHPNLTDEPDDRSAVERQGTDGPGFVCPTCYQPIFLNEAPVNGLVQCPSCGAQFFAATDPGEIAEEARAEAEAEAARDRRLAELSELRVRQVSTLRRSMIRTRGYFVTGAWACIFTALELAWLAGLRFVELHAAGTKGIHVPLRKYAIPTAEALAVIGAMIGCLHFVRRAKLIERELKATAMKDPETPPDLSTLGGGIEQWRGLEQMHGTGMPEE